MEVTEFEIVYRLSTAFSADLIRPLLPDGYKYVFLSPSVVAISTANRRLRSQLSIDVSILNECLYPWIVGYRYKLTINNRRLHIYTAESATELPRDHLHSLREFLTALGS